VDVVFVFADAVVFGVPADWAEAVAGEVCGGEVGAGAAQVIPKARGTRRLRMKRR
jgi:hypothetical protein